jgi:hypothetical protein
MHRSPRGRSTALVLEALRTDGPLASRQLAEAWAADRAVNASDATLAMLTKRVSSTLRSLQHQRLLVQVGHSDAGILWRLIDSVS